VYLKCAVHNVPPVKLVLHSRLATSLAVEMGGYPDVCNAGGCAQVEVHRLCSYTCKHLPEPQPSAVVLLSASAHMTR
jgi:hypothetical protein